MGDCHMLKGMTVEYGDEGKDSKLNDVILFLPEMIPHHQNAVNMAKNLLQTGETKCSLEGLLEAFGVEEQQQCPMANESHAADAKSVKSLFGAVIALIAGLEFLAL